MAPDLRGSKKWNGRCVASVRRELPAGGLGRFYYQCSRKATEQVGRMPLCWQHADIHSFTPMRPADKPPFPVCEEMLADA